MQSVIWMNMKNIARNMRYLIGTVICTTLNCSRGRQRATRDVIARRGLSVSALFSLALLLTTITHVLVPEAIAQQEMERFIIRETHAPPACSGDRCRELLEQLAREMGVGQYKPGRIEKPDPIELTTEQFCTRLAKRKPPSCGPTRPAISGRDGAGGNGCGRGGFANIFAGAAARAAIPNFYQLNEPIKGFFFLGACNGHDICYASQNGRGTCDTTFRTEMSAVCNSNTDCEAAATAYELAVRTQGEDAYRVAGAELQCYKWHADMDKNNCGAQKSAITDLEWQE